MSEGTGNSFTREGLLNEFLALQRKCITLQVIDADTMKTLLSEILTIAEVIVNGVKMTIDSVQQTDAIEMLQELMKCSLAAFRVLNGATAETRMLSIKGFIQVLQMTSNLQGELQQPASTKCLDKLNQCAIEGILGLKKLTEGSFSDADPKLFSDMCDLLIKLCVSVSRHDMKQHVGLIRTYTQLISSIEGLPLLSESSRADLMCEHLVKHIKGCLNVSAECDPVLSKAIGFYVKKLIQMTELTNFATEDDAQQELAAKLRLLQISDHHPLCKDLAGIELWLLSRRTFDTGCTTACSGRTILACDILKNYSELSAKHVQNILELLLNSSRLIVKHMFINVGKGNLFDYAVHAFCVGVSRLDCFDLEDDLLEAAFGDDTCKELFSKDVLRMLLIMWPDKFDAYKEIFQESGFLNITSLVKNARQKHPLRIALEHCLAGDLAKRVDASEHAHFLLCTHPCNSMSALLFSFICARLAPNIDLLNNSTLTSVLNHYCVVLEGNMGNDCLVLAVSIAFSYLPRKSFKDIVDTRLRSVVKKLNEKLLRSGQKIGKLFSLAALFSFVRDVDDVRLITQPTNAQVTVELNELLQGNIQLNKWIDVIDALEVGSRSEAVQLQNEYFKYEPKPSASNSKITKTVIPAEMKNVCLVKELCRLVYELEKNPSLSQEDRALIEVCLEKLRDLVN